MLRLVSFGERARRAWRWRGLHVLGKCFAIAALAVGALHHTPAAGQSNTSRGDPDAGGPEINGATVPFRVRLPGAGRFTPARVLILGPSASYAGPAPRNARAIGGDRLDISSVPLIGRLFGSQPATGAITRERSIGPLLRCGDALALDLRYAPVVVEDVIKRPVAAISSAPRYPILEIEARLNVTGTAGTATPAASCVRIGFVYLQGAPREGRLVLAPPPDELFGW